MIIAVNRLWPQKRVKDLIWSLDLLQCVVDHVHLLIVGDGPQRWRLERYARQVSDNYRVHFLGVRSDVTSLLPHAECLWLGSEYEGQSNAILEAMAAGLPVIATDVTGNRDLVVSGETGYLLPVGDRAGFAARTRELLENPALAHQMGAAGRTRVACEFPVKKMIERYVTLYRECLGRVAAASSTSI